MKRFFLALGKTSYSAIFAPKFQRSMVGLARKPNRIDIVACLDLALSVDLAGIWIDEAEAVANHGVACWLSLSPTNAPASIAFNAGTLAPAVPRG